MQPGTKEVKSLGVLRLIQKADWHEFDDKEMPKFTSSDYGNAAIIKKIFSSGHEELDKAIEILSKRALSNVGFKELIEISRSFKSNISKHFGITEDYLKLYTKDQLYELINELKLEDTEKEFKKTDLIQHILKQKLKGKVPKIML